MVGISPRDMTCMVWPMLGLYWHNMTHGEPMMVLYDPQPLSGAVVHNSMQRPRRLSIKPYCLVLAPRYKSNKTVNDGIIVFVAQFNCSREFLDVREFL